MHLKIIKKINFKKFFILSVPSTILALALTKSKGELGAVLLMYCATVIYLFMFSEAIYLITEPENEKNKKKAGYLFAGKLLILISTAIFCVQIMGNRIIIPIINYVILIFVLGASLKRKD